MTLSRRQVRDAIAADRASIARAEVPPARDARPESTSVLASNDGKIALAMVAYDGIPTASDDGWEIRQGEDNYLDMIADHDGSTAGAWRYRTVARPATRWHGGANGAPGPAFTFAALHRYLTDHGQAPPANSPSTEVGRTREAQLGHGVEIHVHGDQVPANGGHPSEIHIVSVATGQTEKLAVLGPDKDHAMPGEEYGHTYVQVGAWLGRPTHDPADIRTAVLHDAGVTGEISPS